MHRPFVFTTLATVLAGAIPAFAESGDMAAVVVTATRTPSRASEVLSDITVIGREEIERSGQTNLYELLGTQPGIQTLQSGGRGSSGTISIRGSNSNQVLVLIDGQRMSSATSGTTALEHLPLDQIERIEILRGPGGSLYGADAVGGVIQVFTKQGEGQPAPTLYFGAGNYSTTIASAAYGGRVGDTSFHVQAGTEVSNGPSSVKEPRLGKYNSYNPDDDGYRNRNFSLRLSQRVTKDFDLSADYLQINALKHYDNSNCDSNSNNCTTNFDNRTKTYQDSYGVQAGYRVSPLWKSSLRIGQSSDRSTSWRLDQTANAIISDRYDTEQTQATWQNDFATDIGTLMAAAEWRREAVVSTKTYDVSDRTTRSMVLGYQGTVGDHSLQASGRMDDVSRMGINRSGSLAYGYRLQQAWTARVALGTAYHIPTFNDLYWPVDLPNFFRGNPDLKPERSRNQEVGLAYETAGTRAGATLYRNHVTDMIATVTGPAPTFVGYKVNLNKALIRGASFFYDRRTDVWTWKATYDVLSAFDEGTGRYLQRRAPHTGSVEVRRYLSGFDLGAKISSTSVRFNDTANTQKLGGYSVVDLDAAYPIAKDFAITAKLGNLFNKNYVTNASTITPYNEYSVLGRSLFVGLRYAPGK